MGAADRAAVPRPHAGQGARHPAAHAMASGSAVLQRGRPPERQHVVPRRPGRRGRRRSSSSPASHLGPWYMPRTFLDGQAKWFPDGSLEELPDIDGDPERFRVIGWELRTGRRRVLPHADAARRRRRRRPLGGECCRCASWATTWSTPSARGSRRRRSPGWTTTARRRAARRPAVPRAVEGELHDGPRDRDGGPPGAARASREVTADELASTEVQQLIDDLIDTMHDANGAGIAANQIGVPLRVATIEVNHNPRYPYKPPIPLTIVVNPIIEPLDDEVVEINEGCLSVPNLRGTVSRHVNVRVRYLDRDGNAHDEIKRGPDGGHVPARVRSPRRHAVPRPRHRPDDVHHVGPVRALPPRRIHRTDHRVRPARRELIARDGLPLRARLAGRRPSQRRCADRGRRRSHRHRSRPTLRCPPTRRRLAGLTLPGWPTPTATPSTERCAAAPTTVSGSFWTWREQMYALAATLGTRDLPPAGPGSVRRDGAGRHHLRRRVPLPAPSDRRHAVRRSERDGRGVDRRGRRGRHPHHAARRVLPARGLRPTAQRGAATVQ